MGLDALLQQQGWALPGQSPNVIEEPGGTPTMGGDISPLARLVRTIKAQTLTNQMEDKRRQEELKAQADNYNTLRNAGYSPDRAHEAVISGKYPKDVPGLTIEDKTKQAEIGLKESQARVQDATAKKIDAQRGAIQNGLKSKSMIEAQILSKMVGGQPLSPEEQDIYDNVIKKKDSNWMAELMNNEDKKNGVKPATETKPAKPSKPVEGNPDEKVFILGPDGKKYKVPRKNLEAALAKGYKELK